MTTELAPIYIEFKGNAKQLQDTLRVVKGDLTHLNKSTDETGKHVKGMSAMTVAAGAVMADVFKHVAKEVYKFGKESLNAFSDTGKEVRQLQRVIGGTAEDASRLRFAGDELGVSVQNLGMGLKTLAGHLDNNDDKIKRMGISYRDSKGDLLPTKDVLASLADRFKSMPDGLQKSALAVDLFGKSGLKMIPILNQGRDGLKEFYNQSDKLGVTMSGKDLKATKDFTLAQKELHEAIKGAQITIGRNFIGAMTKLVNYIRINVVPWLQSFANGLSGKRGVNDGLNTATTFAHNLGAMLRNTIKFVVTYKNQLMLVAAALFTIWSAVKIVSGLTMVVTAISAITAAWTAVAGAASVATVAETANMVTVAGTTFPMVASITAITAAWEGVTVAATAAAVAEDVASAGTLLPAQLIAGTAAVAAVGGAMYLAYRKLKSKLPTFVAPEVKVPEMPELKEWKPPASTGSGNKGSGAAAPDKTLFQQFKEESQKMKARITLLKLGASKGLVDAVMGANDWSSEFQKLLTGGRSAVAEMQNLYNHTADGITEVANAHKALADAAKKSASATAKANKEQQALNNTMLNSQSWLAAHTAGSLQSNVGSVTVPVSIDGREVFRVVQTHATRNSRRNVSNGLTFTGAVL